MLRKSLEKLSKEADISTGFLSQIERGISSPSLHVLQRICDALGMPIKWLFGDDARDAPDGDIVVRHNSRRRLTFGDLGVEKELLTHDAESGIQLVLMRLASGGLSGKAPFVHEGEMAGMVLTGRVHLRFEGRVIDMAEGDSFRFSGKDPHSWYNPEDSVAEVLISVSPPFY